MSKNSKATEFLLKEYEQCWDYIKFHYEQRDRSQRFFFTFVIGAIGLTVTLAKIDKPPPPIYFLFLLLPLVFLGFFTLNQIIQIRRTTTIFHKAIVTIRAQLIGQYLTPLWLADEAPKNYAPGFHLFTILIIITITAMIAAVAVFIVLTEAEFTFCRSVFLSILAALVLAGGLFMWYRRILTSLDDDYNPLLNGGESGLERKSG